MVGSGCRVCREYGLRSMASGYRLTLVDDETPTWQRAHISDHIPVRFDDTAAVVRAVRERAGPVDGVVTYVEQYLEVTAAIAEDLGVPHNSVHTVRACRDKLLTRQALDAAGVPSARSVPVGSLAEALRVGADIGYPVVLKPRNLAGSVGVVRVDDAGAMTRSYDLSAASRLGGVDGPVQLLVEEYLDGPQISVECVTVAGRTEVACVTDHVVEFPPYFEQGAHVVDTASPLADPASPAVDVAVAALDALGVEYGVTHTELRLTSRGPRVVEVNARLAGARIPYLWRLASGVDLARAAADAAVGVVPDLAPERSGAAAIKHIYPHAAGVVTGLRGGPALDDPPWFHELVWEKSVGETVKPPPNGLDDVLGSLIVTGEDAAACRRNMEEAMRHVTVDIAGPGPEPPAEPEARAASVAGAAAGDGAR
ncbi:ATP-grasp domain-containing protein [Sphaerisporangium sp. TRM90804]|uniref:ATP-grasp domain-containing protein n=1 Tax=Sphaerisporangium sp. TRM90804 TaxID=3031113 RepID=UPI00244C6F02|nr:ATP-grasp domain-containing protein [Sphaerisporangium sp. TRM90804]MDH2429193.1 ATP-grasp domain-containing protein [Sphaerisporangium sp. TRM90804]